MSFYLLRCYYCCFQIGGGGWGSGFILIMVILLPSNKLSLCPEVPSSTWPASHVSFCVRYYTSTMQITADNLLTHLPLKILLLFVLSPRERSLINHSGQKSPFLSQERIKEQVNFTFHLVSEPCLVQTSASLTSFSLPAKITVKAFQLFVTVHLLTKNWLNINLFLIYLGGPNTILHYHL